MKSLRTAFAVVVLAALLSACAAPTTTIPDIPVVLSESLYDRSVVHRDANGNDIESWYYDSTGALREYSVYHYNALGQNDEVSIYSSATKLDATTKTIRIVYIYDAAWNITRGELYKCASGASDTLINYYDATYDAAGNCTKYKEWVRVGGIDTIVKHRTCTFGADGYDTETYYSDDAGTAVLERYICSYDGAGNYVKELHYLKIPADSGVDLSNNNLISPAAAYERNMTYTYTWNAAGKMYLQTDFDENSHMVRGIMYTYNDSGKASTRSSINGDGKVILYRTYAYDSQKRKIEVRNYNYAMPEDEQLKTKESYSYTSSGDGTSLYETWNYIYTYESKSLGTADSFANQGRLIKPVLEHHREG